MKKHLSVISLSLALLASAVSYSQNQHGVNPCGTYEAMDLHFADNPEAKMAYDKSQNEFNKKCLENKSLLGKSKAAAVQYTIPVVFHVLHMGGGENVSDATIISGLQYLNDDYAKAHSDASLTAAPFASLHIACDIKLMLAKKDPNGNCITGIVRHVDPKTVWNQNIAGGPSGSYYTYTWDPTKYLNVYLVTNITGGAGNTLGYTYKPGTWPTGDAHDAIVISSSFFTGSQKRALSHELAHWLNISHTWGDTNSPEVDCSGTDNCADTPPTKGKYGGCPSSLSGNTCPGSGGLDNVQNIMNYADCPINFTADQTNRMRTALVSPTSGRSNIISAGNLTATGVNIVSNCAPICDFISNDNSYTVCSGSSLIFKSVSYNGTISAYSWAGDNGATAASPTAAQTSITFTNVGTSVVTLTVTNGIGSSSSSKTVTVLNGAVLVPNNYFEGFEAPGLPANWTVINPNAGSVEWEQTGLAAIEGTSSYYINGIANIANQIDYLQMPIINPLVNQLNTVFTFKYAYQRASATNNDKFEVQASKDCGGTWTTVVGLSAGTMANASGGVSASPYVPQAADWVMYDVYNHPLWFQFTAYSSVMVRFMFQEDAGGVGFGNRFYLDDIIFSDPNGVNELTKAINFGMYPNPSKGETTLQFTLSDAAQIKVEVLDLLGKVILPVVDSKFSPGTQNISFNKNNTLSKGIYLVNLTLNGTKMSRKLVIE